MKESGKTISNMGREYIGSKMEIFMKASFKMAYKMAKEF